MQPFTFQFDPLLKQKRAEETRCQRNLAQHLAKRIDIHNRLRRTQSTISQSKHDIADALTGSVNLDAISNVARYTASVTNQGHADVLVLAELEQTITQARTALTEARRHVKALEMLREKKHEQWLTEQRRIETAQLDEAATQNWLRQQREAAQADQAREAAA
ncbi:MAG: flagellar export protein FliJ [Planctomycetota bacterium]